MNKHTCVSIASCKPLSNHECPGLEKRQIHKGRLKQENAKEMKWKSYGTCPGALLSSGLPANKHIHCLNNFELGSPLLAAQSILSDRILLYCSGTFGGQFENHLFILQLWGLTPAPAAFPLYTLASQCSLLTTNLGTPISGHCNSFQEVSILLLKVGLRKGLSLLPGDGLWLDPVYRRIGCTFLWLWTWWCAGHC